MFNKCHIEHRDYLSKIDFDEAEKFVREGMSFDRALGYLRGWAQEYARVAYCDSRAANAFHDAAYGRD